MKGKINEIYLYLILIVILVFVPVYAGELVFRTVLNGKVTLLAPEDFGPMKKELIEIKYPLSSRPTEVLSNDSGSVTLAFSHTKSLMTQAQVKQAHQSISKSFHNMYPTAEWIRDETVVKDGLNFMVLELITPAADTSIHNIIYGTSLDNRFLLVAFNTTVEQSQEWLPVGKRIMSSLKIKKSKSR